MMDAIKTEIERLRGALQSIFCNASSRRAYAAERLDNIDPSIAPYASTQAEAFCYWRGFREGLSGINANAYDVLHHGKVLPTCIEKAAYKILSCWIEWEQEAAQRSQVAQDNRAGETYLHLQIVTVLNAMLNQESA